MNRFARRVAVVTGAASGIGAAIAQRFAEEGASVALVDVDGEKGNAVADKFRRAGGKCEFIRADVASESDVRAAIDEVLRRFGSVDHLVNNAGLVLVKSIEDCSAEEWDRVMAVNLKSVFLTVKHCLPSLKRTRNATIVNTGSISSFVGQQSTPAYVASKGGVLLLSKALALDLAPDGIRVNCVCPGITDTPMFRFHINAAADPDQMLSARLNRVPLGRALSPREIADSVLYLSSAESSGVTGTSLVVDAGYTAAAEWSLP